MAIKFDIEMNLTEITDEEMEQAENWIREGIFDDRTRFSGMSYEQGMEDMLRWLSGEESFEDTFSSRD